MFWVLLLNTALNLEQYLGNDQKQIDLDKRVQLY
jgi:hypothetical protein